MGDVREYFHPGYLYEPKEGTQQLMVDAPTGLAVLGVLQYFAFSGIFFYFFWVLSANEITTVLISSEILEPPYDCDVLSPFSGQEVFDYDTSESVIISRAMYQYDECMDALTDLGVCNQTMTQSNILSIYGFDSPSTSDDCVDVPLHYIRFCYGAPSTGPLDTDATDSFPEVEPYPRIILCTS